MYEYETVTFGCFFNSRESFNSKLQEVLDSYAVEGWRLHTMQVAGSSASTCICVFEREID